MPSLLNRALAKRVMGRGEGALESVIYSRSNASHMFSENNPSWGADILGLGHNNRYQGRGGGASFTRGDEAWGEVVSSQREPVKTAKFSGGKGSYKNPKGSYKNPTTGVRLPGRSAAYATPPAAPAAAPKASASGKPFNWGISLATGAVGGGFMANFMASPEDRGFGTFAKGAAFGTMGGLGMHMAGGAKLMSTAAKSANSFAKKQGSDFGQSWSEGAYQMAKMAESKESRAMAWGAGAMLAGGIAGSGRSKAHGINGNRGNRFGA